MPYTDVVQVICDAITAATNTPTARVLQPGFTEGPLPLAHVALVQSQDLDYERTDTISIDIYATTPSTNSDVGASALAGKLRAALAVRPVVGGDGWVDEVSVDSILGVRPYYEAVEVVNMTVSATHRPICD